MKEFYDHDSVPIRCDCGRPPEIIRGEILQDFLRLLPGWKPEWESSVQYFACCSGSLCEWTEFTLDNPPEVLQVFLVRLYDQDEVRLAVLRRFVEAHGAPGGRALPM